MNDSTLTLLVLMKTIELLYNWILFGFMIAGIAQIKNDLDTVEAGPVLTILTIVGIVIQYFHCMFNNLF